ncbi:MAG TPA: outer membrane beta-barrel protein [Patescibacteria group bacterium]|nr:outer membrane beta-barrel protein [Patescibacteria group bacterium]
MRAGTILAAVGLLVAISFPLHAQQQAPKFEVAGAYSYMRLDLVGPNYSEGLQTNGGTGSVAFNLTNSLGIVGEIGDYKTSTVSSAGGASMTFASYLFGPRYSFRGSDLLTPYVQTLFGGVKGNNSFTITNNSQPVVLHTDQNAFAWTVGGGLDAAVTKHLAIRVFQVEYFLTKWPEGPSNHQSNFRFETGLVFSFGKR